MLYFQRFWKFSGCSKTWLTISNRIGEEENFVSSDAVSLSVFSKQICYLEEGDYAALQDKVQTFDCLGKVEREVKILKSDPVNLTKGKYKHLWKRKFLNNQK